MAVFWSQVSVFRSSGLLAALPHYGSLLGSLVKERSLIEHQILLFLLSWLGFALRSERRAGSLRSCLLAGWHRFHNDREMETRP